MFNIHITGYEIASWLQVASYNHGEFKGKARTSSLEQTKCYGISAATAPLGAAANNDSIGWSASYAEIHEYTTDSA